MDKDKLTYEEALDRLCNATSPASPYLQLMEMWQLKKILQPLIDKEDNPVEPVCKNNNGRILVYCGICGKRLDLTTIKKYCPYCGQRIDWGDEDETD